MRPQLLEGFVGAKATLDHFIERGNLQGSPLADLVRRNQDLACAGAGWGELRRAVRAQVLDELTKHWLTESGA